MISDEKFKERLAEVTWEEMHTPEVWHYLSFAEEKFNGAVIILGRGLTDCLSRAHRLGINPGGEVLAAPIPPGAIDTVPEADRMRLLSAEDVKRIWPDAKSIREHEAEEEAQ